jgi:TP901 family phage tail tape measure protein
LADDLRVSLIGELNEPATRKEVQKGLKDLGKSLDGIDLGKMTSMSETFKKNKAGVMELNKTIKIFKDEMGKTTRVVHNADGSIDKMSTTMKKLKTNTKGAADTQKKLTSATKEGAKASLTFGDQLRENTKKFSSWSLITTAYFAAIRGLKQMLQEVKALDDALVEMSKVSELSGESLERFGDKAAVVGEKINETASKVIQAAADFSRMGFTENESLRLAEDAIVLTKIADGITETDEATTALITTLKGFNMAASESGHILDALNEVSNNYAINTDDLAEGLRRTAGVMAQSNTSFEETIGLLTGAQESLQNIEKVSSGLITISTRLRKVGESTEDVNGLMVKLDETFMKYTNNAVRIEDANGGLRSTYDILFDLAQVWDTLDDKSQAYLGFLASGLRQTPVLNSVMSNLKNTVGATATAMESAGSAQEEFEKVMESLQGKLDKLGATWSRISTDFISSDFLKGLLAIADGSSKVIETLGLMNVVLLSLSVLISKKFILLLPTLAAKLAIMAEGFGVATAAASTFGVVMSGIFIGGALIAGMALFSASQKKTTEDLINATDALKEYTAEHAKVEDLIESLVGATLGTAEFVEITTQLNAILPRATDAIDAETDSLEDQLSVYRDLNDIKKMQLIEKAKDTIADTRDLNTLNELINRNANTLKFAEEDRDRLLTKRIKLQKEGNDLSLIEQLQLKGYAKDVDKASERVERFNAELDAYNEALRVIQDANLPQHLIDGYHAAEELKNEMRELRIAAEGVVEATDLEVQAQRDLIDSFNMTLDKIDEMSAEYEYLSSRKQEEAKMFIRSEIEKTEALIENIKSRIKAERAFEAAQLADTMGEIFVPENVGRGYTELLNLLDDEIFKVNKLTGELGSLFDIDKKLAKVTEKVTKATKEETESFKDLSSQIESENVAGVKKYQDTIIEAMDEEKELINRNKDAWERDFDDRKTASDRYYEDTREVWERDFDDRKDASDKYQDETREVWERDFDDRRDLNDEYHDELISGISNEIDALKEKRSIEKEIEDIQNSQLQLVKLQQNLQDIAKQRNVRVLTASGWQWVADPSQIKAANEEIAKVEDELLAKRKAKDEADVLRALEDTKQQYQDQKELADKAFDDEQKAMSRHFDDRKTITDEAFDAEQKSISRHYDDQSLRIERAFEDEKTLIERGYEDQFDIIGGYLDDISDIETSSYTERLLQLNAYVNAYNSKMASIGSTSTISGGMPPTTTDPGAAPENETEAAIQQMKINSLKWHGATDSEKAKLAAESLNLGTGMGWTRNANGEWIDSSGNRAFGSSTPTLNLGNQQSMNSNLMGNVGGFDQSMMANKTPVSSGASGDTFNLSITTPNGATLNSILIEAKQLAKHGR